MHWLPATFPPFVPLPLSAEATSLTLRPETGQYAFRRNFLDPSHMIAVHVWWDFRL